MKVDRKKHEQRTDERSRERKKRAHTTYDRNENSVMDPDIKTSHLFLLQ